MRTLKTQLAWAFHNIIAHPMYQMLWVVSCFGRIKPIAKIAYFVHDSTTPKARWVV